MIGFFEEAEGVRSMTRLAIFALLVMSSALVAAIITYVFVTARPSAAVIGALVGALTAVVAQGVVAIINRNGGTGTDT